MLGAPEHRQEARLRRAALDGPAAERGAAAAAVKASLASVAVIGPLADSKADTEGSWMVFGHVPAAVTVLEGIRAKLPGREGRLRPGPEIRASDPVVLRRLHPRAEKPPTQTPEEAEAAFRQAVDTARGAEPWSWCWASGQT